MPTRIRTWARARRVVLTISHRDVFLVVDLSADAAGALADDLRWAEAIASHEPDSMPQFHEIQLYPETES